MLYLVYEVTGLFLLLLVEWGRGGRRGSFNDAINC